MTKVYSLYQIFFCLLIVSNLTACQINPSENEEDDSFSPGESRDLSNIEVAQVKTFCTSITQYRKVVKSSQINDQVTLAVTSNSCDDQNLSTQTYSAIYDQTIEGTLYYQSADDLCYERIWTEQVQPLKTFCMGVLGGQTQDRIQIDLSLYVFSAAVDNSYGTKVTIREFSVNPNNSSDYTFQSNHDLYVYTLSNNGNYGKVMNYAKEILCDDNKSIQHCSQMEQ